MVESFVPIGIVIAAMTVMEEDVFFVPDDILEIMTADHVWDAKIFLKIFKPFAEITTRCQSVNKLIIVENPTTSPKDYLSLLYVLFVLRSPETSAAVSNLMRPCRNFGIPWHRHSTYCNFLCVRPLEEQALRLMLLIPIIF